MDTNNLIALQIYSPFKGYQISETETLLYYSMKYKIEFDSKFITFFYQF